MSSAAAVGARGAEGRFGVSRKQERERSQDSRNERSHACIETCRHETKSSRLSNAVEEERPGFEAGLDEWCSQSYTAKGSLPSRKHGFFLMFLIQQA